MQQYSYNIIHFIYAGIMCTCSELPLRRYNSVTVDRVVFIFYQFFFFFGFNTGKKLLVVLQKKIIT